MKKIIIILLFISIIFSCSQNIIDDNYVINNGKIEFCEYVLLDTWCWDENCGIWYDLDLSGYTNGKAIVEISLKFIDSLDYTIDATSIQIRKDSLSQEYCIYANHIQGSSIIITDDNGKIQWKHDNNIDVSRKINIQIKLTMIQI